MPRIIQRLQRIEGLSLLEDGAGYVALLRLSPGAAIPLHRHSGETHLYNLSGSRQLHTGEIIGPHGYVQEPCGTVDSWKTWGDEPAEVLLMVRGRIEYMDAAGEVTVGFDAKTIEAAYRAFRETQ